MVSTFAIVAVVLSTIAFFYCFVFVDRDGTGIQAKMKRFLYEELPDSMKRGVKACLGERAVWAIERAQRWLCYEANPLIQIFYLILAIGGYAGYVLYGFQHVPNPYVAEYHKYVAWPFMALCYWSYWKACSTDPGYMRKTTPKDQLERAMKRYEFDNMLFSSDSWCETCDIPKPARSKHCSMCGCCCEKFDHHCVWINACVGLHNYKYFILFLFLHCAICIYGLTVGLLCAYHLANEQDLWSKVFFSTSGQRHEATYWIVFSYLHSKEELFFTVVFLCGIVTVMLIGFLGYHTYLISRGMTTNEAMKITGVSKFVDKKLEFMKKWNKARQDKKPFKPKQKSID